ncbi:cupredoxin domain-containing protein [Candidatus Woesearchaeota archaeon]|nr:cupredoxin domain-containing protein [Candidatus Woesearchaeota archaeon]
MRKLSIIISILVVFLISGCGVNIKPCTKEAMVCEDGTVISREGINCEFPECPEPDIIQEESEEVIESEVEVIESEPIPEPVPEPEPEPTPELESTVKEFDMTAKKWDFEPATIIVNEGDTVILHITSVDVTHGFGLSAFGINEDLRKGETVDIEFIANQKGTFTFKCIVSCGSGHSGMKGQLIVE